MSTYVRDDVAAMLAMAAATPRPTLRELGPVAARQTMLDLGKRVDLPLGELAIVKNFDVPRRDGGTVGVRYFDARSERSESPVLVFFHGGGFVFGDLDTHASVCAEIAREMDLPVLAVDYRLAPENPWPAAQDDCEDVALWLADAPASLGFAATGQLLCGDSAGGWLAVVVALRLMENRPDLALPALGLIYPLIDMNCARHASFDECGTGYTLTADGMGWFLECFGADENDPTFDLTQCVRADLPPTVVISAGLDPLRDQGRAFASALALAGGTSLHLEARGIVHGFIGSRQALPSARDDLHDFISMLAAASRLKRPRIDARR